MDPMITDLLSKLGMQAGKELVSSIIRYWEERKKKKLTPSEKREIAEVAQSLIQVASLEDVHRYNPLVRRIEEASRGAAAGATTSPARRGSATKRGGPAKRGASKKAAVKVSSGKKVAVKKTAAKWSVGANKVAGKRAHRLPGPRG